MNFFLLKCFSSYNQSQGASSGIGSEIAVLFSKLGASLILHGRNEVGLNETIERCDQSARNRVIIF